MKVEIEYIDMETGEIKTSEELLPNALPARLTNKCESLYKATVTAKGSNKKAEMEDPFEAVKQVKEEVMTYLLDKWIKTEDLNLDNITGESQNKIVGEYEKDLYGVGTKKKED